MSKAAAIIADMKAELAASEGKRRKRKAPKERYPLDTTSGRKAAAEAAAKLLKAEEHQERSYIRYEEEKLTEAVKRFNNRFRSKNGKPDQDMLEALLAFFCENHENVAEQALVSALPTKVSMAQAKALFEDEFVRDVVEGFGGRIPSTAKEYADLIRSINPATSHAGGRPRKVRIVDTFGQGHSRDYTSGAVPEGRIPSPEGGTMRGPGFDQGAGWEDVWAGQVYEGPFYEEGKPTWRLVEGRPLTPAQARRRDAYLDFLWEENRRQDGEA